MLTERPSDADAVTVTPSVSHELCCCCYGLMAQKKPRRKLDNDAFSLFTRVGVKIEFFLVSASIGSKDRRTAVTNGGKLCIWRDKSPLVVSSRHFLLSLHSEGRFRNCSQRNGLQYITPTDRLLVETLYSTFIYKKALAK